MRTTFLLSTSMAHIFNTKHALVSYSENSRDVPTLDGVQRSEGSGTARFSTGQYLIELPNAYYVPTAEDNEVSIPLLLMDGARANRNDDVWEIWYQQRLVFATVDFVIHARFMITAEPYDTRQLRIADAYKDGNGDMSAREKMLLTTHRSRRE